MVDIVKMSQDKARSHHSRALSQYNSIQTDISNTIDNVDSAAQLSEQAMLELNPLYKEQMTNELMNEPAIHAIIRDKGTKTGQMYQAIEEAMKKYFKDEVDISNMAERVMTQVVRESDNQPLINNSNNNNINSYGSTNNSNTMSVAEMRNASNNNNKNNNTNKYNYHMGVGDSSEEEEFDDLTDMNNNALQQGREQVTDLIHIEDSILSFLDDPKEARKMAQEILLSVMRSEPMDLYPNTEEELLFMMYPGYIPMQQMQAIEYPPTNPNTANNSQSTIDASTIKNENSKNVSASNGNGAFKSGIARGLAEMGVQNDPYTPSSVRSVNVSEIGVGTHSNGSINNNNNNNNNGVPDWIQDPTLAEEMADDPQIKAATRSHKRKVSLFNAIKSTMHHKFENPMEANAMASNVMKEILWTKDMTNELVSDNTVQSAIKHHRRRVSLFKAVKDTMQETFANDLQWADKMARGVMKQIVANKELAKDLIVNDETVKQVQQRHQRKISMFNALKSTMNEKFDDPKKATMMAQQVMKEIVATRKEMKNKQGKRGSVDLSKENGNENENGERRSQGNDGSNMNNENEDDIWSLKSDDSIYDFLDTLNTEMKQKEQTEQIERGLAGMDDDRKIDNLLQNQNVQLQMLSHARKASTFQGLKGVISTQLQDSDEGTRLARKIMKKLVEDQKAHGLSGYGTGRRESINHMYVKSGRNENENDGMISGISGMNENENRYGNTNDMQNVINQQAEVIEKHKNELKKTKQELMACYTIIQLQNEELQKVKSQIEDLRKSKQQLAINTNESINQMRNYIKQYQKQRE